MAWVGEFDGFIVILQAQPGVSHCTENIFMVDAHKSKNIMIYISLKAVYVLDQDTAV